MLFVMLAAGLVIVWSSHGADTSLPTRRLTVDDTTYNLEIASASADQERGLSGRRGLPVDAGMLFEHTTVAERCIWMKDMQFAIDIVWTDTEKRIIKVMADVRPDTYPQAFCADAQYVIELKAGEAAQRQLRPGQVLQF